MKVVEKIQTALLPRENLYEGFDISAKMIPAEIVGGDYYDIFTDCDNNLWFAIGDVSGHGITAGLIMMMAQTSHYQYLKAHSGCSPLTPVRLPGYQK